MTTKKPSCLRQLPVLLGSLALALTGLVVAAPPAHGVPTSDGLSDITITQVNAPQDGIYAVGDVMNFDIAVTNNGTEARSFTPVDTNLGGNVGRCKWSSIAAGQTKTDCTGLATHTVTAEDIAAGGFTPHISYEIKAAGYKGSALNTPETISGETSPIKAATLRLESFTLKSPKETYTVGDTVAYVVRVRSLSDKTIHVAATDSTFDDLGAQCNWRGLKPGEKAVYNCRDLSHTITQADADRGQWAPSITLSATGTDGTELHTLTGTGDPLTVVVERPQAEPAPVPDADPAREAFMSEAQQLVANTATDKYRIPAITTAPNGDLLVAYDERPIDNGNGGGDSPNPNHIVQRRSTDGGATWSAPTYIHQGTETGQKVGYSDPSYVVDYQTGTIFNFHVKSYDQGWPGSRAGSDPQDRNVIQAEVSTSTDNGWSWTHRTITADITTDPSWIARFAASGQGIQIQHGPHAGRLVQQYTIKTSSGAIQAVSVYSDDHGATWKAGRPAGTGMDENKVVELSDGTLMLNSRVSDGTGYRKVATSTDGGQTWSEPRSDTNLPDSVDNAQIIRAFPSAEPGDPRAKVLLLSHSPNPAPWSRDRGTISLSCDDGASWATGRVFNERFIGYSTIAVQSNGTIGLLSEDENYNGIWYRNFSLAWVGDHCTQVHASAAASSPSLHPGADATVTVSVTNPTAQELTGLTVAAPQVEGLSITPATTGPQTLAAGATATYEFTVATAGGTGQAELTFPVTWEGGSAQASVSLYSAAGPDIRPEAVAADSEELVGETPPNGRASAAVDGDPATFWHTQWKDAAPGFDPQTGHWIDLKVPESAVPADQTPHLAGLTYLARQGHNMGRAKDYRIFTSQDGKTWSAEPAASGTLADTAEPQRIAVEAGARYVRFMALNSYSTGRNAAFLVAAEIGLTLDARAGQSEPAPSPEPTPEPSAQPSEAPTAQPSEGASAAPGGESSAQPSDESSTGSPAPGEEPTQAPGGESSTEPTGESSTAPTGAPGGQATTQPSTEASAEPSGDSTGQPTGRPSTGSTAPDGGSAGTPDGGSTSMPDGGASAVPTGGTTTAPSAVPSGRPVPSAQATDQPSSSAQPSTEPEEINRPSDGAMVPPAQDAGAQGTAGASATGAATSAPGMGLARTGATLLPVLGLAGLALGGGYLALRLRRAQG